MKKLVFIGFFVCLLLASSASAETEKKYLNIGGDPVMKDICKKRSLKTFNLPEDTFVATTGKSRKVYVGWMRAGEEIGWFNQEQTEYVICRCGNSVKFLQTPQEKVESKPELKPEPVVLTTPATPAVSAPEQEKKKKIIVIINKTEPVYVPVESRPFVDYGWGGGYYRPYYGGGYAVGGGRVIHSDRHRDRHRDYSRDYRRDHRRPPEPRQRPEPRPRPEQRPRPVHPPTPPIPH